MPDNSLAHAELTPLAKTLTRLKCRWTPAWFVGTFRGGPRLAWHGEWETHWVGLDKGELAIDEFKEIAARVIYAGYMTRYIGRSVSFDAEVANKWSHGINKNIFSERGAALVLIHYHA